MQPDDPHLAYVLLYTDGACAGNPGPGGWAYVLIHPASAKQREESGGEPHTTNNRMELMAVIRGLTALRRPMTVDLYSDSQYVLKGMSEWLPGWKRAGWRTADRQPVKNQDLWQSLDGFLATHKIRFHWVRGHSGHPQNERCDRLAVAARDAARSGYAPKDRLVVGDVPGAQTLSRGAGAGSRRLGDDLT